MADPLAEYRASQKDKWESKTGSRGENASAKSTELPTQQPSSSSSSQPDNPEAIPTVSRTSRQTSSSSSSGPLQQVHILPLARPFNGSPLQEVGGLLKETRRSNSILKKGTLFTKEDSMYIVVACKPQSGFLDHDTEFYFDGPAVVPISKLHLLGLPRGDGEEGPVNSEEAFSSYVQPFFQSEQSALSAPSSTSRRVSVISQGGVLDILGMKFVVLAAAMKEGGGDAPLGGVGIVSEETELFVDLDDTSEYSRVHVVPFQDTLPRVYEYDIFSDYLRPYLSTYPHYRFKVNDQFTFHGVQFRVVCVEPEGSPPLRIGRSTLIYCEGALPPTIRNLLPPDVVEQLQNLPPGLQMLLLNTELLGNAGQGDLYERLTDIQDTVSGGRRGLSQQTIQLIPEEIWHREMAPRTSQQKCMICLNDFEVGEAVRFLPCPHVFHSDCIDEWLRRCTDCPICKRNIDRALRGY